MLVDKKAREMICTALSKSKKYDFKLFEESSVLIYVILGIHLCDEPFQCVFFPPSAKKNGSWEELGALSEIS